MLKMKLQASLAKSKTKLANQHRRSQVVPNQLSTINPKKILQSSLLIACLSALSSISAISNAATYQVVYHVVEANENLTGLAKKFNVSVTDLTKVNGLETDIIQEGQRLLIPINKVVTGSASKSKTSQSTASKSNKGKNKASENKYRVKSGDTLLGIAKKYKVSLSALTSTNNIDSSYQLQIGDLLVIPSSKNKKELVNPSKQSSGKNTTKNEKTKAPKKTTSTAGSHKVRSGDSIGYIAQKYGVSQSKLIELNNISNANALKIGQVLKLPKTTGKTTTSKTSANKTTTKKNKGDKTASTARAHKVRSGDNIGHIAQKYGVSQGELIELNNISNVNALKIGQVLKLPKASGEAGTHKVSSGDNIGYIAQKYGVSQSELIELNDISNVNALRIGQVLKLPKKSNANAKANHKSRGKTTTSKATANTATVIVDDDTY